MIPQSIKSVEYIPWLVLANLSAERFYLPNPFIFITLGDFPPNFIALLELNLIIFIFPSLNFDFNFTIIVNVP
jgi:hypothetical protein